jgi:hypothetical protein
MTEWLEDHVAAIGSLKSILAYLVDFGDRVGPLGEK